MKIYQIEISNLCNLTCEYCPHPTQERDKGLMSSEVFKKAIELVRRCGQRRVYLHNFGEPLLHPLIFEFIKYATARGVTTSFYTNGLLLDESMAERLAAAGLREICVSGHVAGEITRIQALLQRCSIPIQILDTFRPSKETLHTWADQVLTRTAKGAFETGMPLPLKPCIFERENAVVILWDGRVNVCCIDNEATGVSGTIDDYLTTSSYYFRPIPLCKTCTLMRGDEDLS
jgi:hypothetical protein